MEISESSSFQWKASCWLPRTKLMRSSRFWFDCTYISEDLYAQRTSQRTCTNIRNLYAQKEYFPDNARINMVEKLNTAMYRYQILQMSALLMIASSSLMIECSSLMIECSSLMIECSSLMIECSSLMIESSSLMIECSSLMIECSSLMIPCLFTML